MPVTKGRYTVGLKTSGGVNIPSDTSTQTIAETGKAVSDVFFQLAQKKQEYNLISSFTTDVENDYSQFMNDYKNDPAAMRDQTETYSKAKINNLPLAYREYATKYLAAKNSTLITKATNNKIKIDDETFDFNYLNRKTRSDASEGIVLETILNSNIINPQVKVNELSDIWNDKISDEKNNLFGQTMMAKPEKSNTYRKDYNENLKNSQAKLLAYKMIAIDDTKKAFGISESFMQNGNLFTNIDPKELKKTTNDAIILSKDLIERKEIHTKALNLYAEYRNTTIDKLRVEGKSDTSLKINAFKNFEVGSPNHLGTAKNMNLENIDQKILELYPDASATQKTEVLIPGFDNIKTRLKNVKDFLTNKPDAITSLNDKDKERLADDILQYYNINDFKTILDPNNRDAATAIDLLSQLDYTPSKLKQALSTDLNLKSDTLKDTFIIKKNIYDRLKGNRGVPIDLGEDNGLYEAAETYGWSSLTNTELANKIIEFKNKPIDFKKQYSDVSNLIQENYEKFDSLLTDTLTDIEGSKWAPIVFGKFIADEALTAIGLDVIETRGEREQKLSADVIAESGLFGPNVNILPTFGNFNYSQDVKNKIKDLTINNFLSLKRNNPDITADENKNAFQIATRKALKTLDAEGYGFTKYNAKFDNKKGASYIKNPFEKFSDANDREIRLTALSTFNAFINGKSDAELNQLLGSDINGNPYSKEDIRKHILAGNDSLIIKAVPGTKDKNGKPRFRLSIMNPNGDIMNIQKQGEFFSASESWISDLPNTNLPATRNNIKFYAAKEALDNFKNNYSHLIPKGLEKIVERAFLGWEKFRIEATNFDLFVTDVPFKKFPVEMKLEITDIPFRKLPLEIKPFRYLFNLLGKEVNLEKELNTLMKIERQRLDAISVGEKLIQSSKGNSIEKSLESIYPPNQMTYNNYAQNIRFKDFVEKNYNNKSLPLTFRTNNYLALHENPNVKWDNSLDLKANKLVTFARPSDGYRAGIVSIINKSTLSKNNVQKMYGDSPTVKEVIDSWAENKQSYYKTIERETGWDLNQKINLLKFDDIYKLTRAMTIHEMGKDAYSKYYGQNESMIALWIKEGFDRAKQHVDIQ